MTLDVVCEHEFGALGAVSGDYCIHCGAKLSDLKPLVLKRFIFTFGFSQTNPVTGEDMGGCFTVVQAVDREAARHSMNSVWGRQWAFQYDSPQEAGTTEYNLREVPQCPHPDRDSCWDDQQSNRMDANFECPVHGQQHDTLERLGVDVL